MKNKEEQEGKQITVFARLFNQSCGADYEVGQPLRQDSIVDRELLSPSGHYKTLRIQIKDVIDFDTTEFKQSIMGDTKVWDSNIFRLLTPLLEWAEKKYGKTAEGIVLVLNVGVSESWIKDYIPPISISNYNFSAIYCLGLPSSENLQGYIFPLKDLDMALLKSVYHV